MNEKKYHYEVESFLEPIFPDFLNDRKADLVEQAQAINNKDFNALSLLGHKLAGNAGSYGLPELGDLGKELEIMAQAQDYDKCKKIHLQIEEFLENLTVDFI